jgi:hypothetical protein
MHIVMGLGPSHDPRTPLPPAPPGRHPHSEPEATSSVLMVKCSRHVIPAAIQGRPHRPAGARSRPRAPGSGDCKC